MFCVRCGRETEENQAFCQSCLLEMERFPVDPDTVVSLPHRQGTVRKAPRRKGPTPEEQVVTLSRRLHRLTVAFLIALALCTALSFLLYRSISSGYSKGQNYKSIPAVSEPLTSETQAATEAG